MEEKIKYVFYHESTGRENGIATSPIAPNIFPKDSMLAAAHRFPGRVADEPVYISIPEHLDPNNALRVIWALDHFDAPFEQKLRNITHNVSQVYDYFCIRDSIVILTQLLKRAVYLWNIKRVLRAKIMKPGASFIKRMTLRSGLGVLSEHHFYHGFIWEPATLRATLSILYIQQVSPYEVKRVPIIQGWNGALKTPIPGATNWILRFYTEAGEETTPEHVYCRASVLRDTPCKTIAPFYFTAGDNVKLYVTYGAQGTISTITDVHPYECYIYLYEYRHCLLHDVFSRKMNYNRRVCM